jgi:hypothetical protein
MVKVVLLVEAVPPKIKPVGLLAGRFEVPDDIETPFAKDIKEMFGL